MTKSYDIVDNIGPLERDARDYLGPRADGVPESAYLKALFELVRVHEKLNEAMRKVR